MVSRGDRRCSGSFCSSSAVRPSLRPGEPVTWNTVCSDGRRRSRVDQQHAALVRLAQRQRQVRRRQRLAFAGHGARDHDDLQPVRRLGLVQRRRQRRYCSRDAGSICLSTTIFRDNRVVDVIERHE